MSRIAPVLNVLSKVVMLFAATFLLPLSLSWILDDGAQRAYDEAIIITFVAGALTWLFTRKAHRELQTRDGFLLVVLAAAIEPVQRIGSGRFKVHPIYDWTDRDVYEYLKRHDLPYHPLWERGYVSIGDWHTTRSLREAGDDADGTRFFGLQRECGLHLIGAAAAR